MCRPQGPARGSLPCSLSPPWSSRTQTFQRNVISAFRHGMRPTMRLALTVASLILSCSPITAEDGSMGKLRTTFAPGLHSAILTTKHTVTPRQRKPGVEPQPLQLRPAFVTLPTRPVLRACLLPRVLLQASGGISAPPLKHVLEGEAKWRVATFHVCVSSSITLLEVFDLLLRLALSIFRAICAILHALGLGAVMTGLRTALAQGRAAALRHHCFLHVQQKH